MGGAIDKARWTSNERLAISRGHKPMADPDLPSPDRSARRRRVSKKAARLTGREYLPLLFTVALWALTALAIGHADAARLLAVTVLVRALAMLTQMSTLSAVRKRWHRDAAVRRQAVGKAGVIQLCVALATALLLAPFAWFLEVHDQHLMALMLPLVALGIPARLYRSVDLRAFSRLFRLSATGLGLAGAGLAYLMDSGPLGYALVFGLREWAAAIVTALVSSDVKPTKFPTDAPLTLAEVARDTVVASRRRLTYRITKNLLTVLGPFGNAAARTGRGLNWHSRLEPYLPHKKSGFWFFALVTGAISIFLIVRSGEPLAMIAAAGVFQLTAVAVNVLLWWRYLPDRNDPDLQVEDDDD